MNGRIRRTIKKAIQQVEFRICQRKYQGMSYVMKHRNAPSDALIVVFSGFSPKGKPPRYNYIETLRNINATQLFVLDDTGYNRAGSYYLGDDNSFCVPEQVCKLIAKTKQKYNKKRLITCGSSKGGTMAIYYGLKLHADAVVCGAPQYRIGTYLQTAEHMPILMGIIGNVTEKKINFLNDLLENEIVAHSCDTHNPWIYMHYSPEEHTFHEHIAELIEKLKSCGYSMTLDNNYSYKNHGDVGQYFKKYLLQTMKLLTGER